MKFLVSLLAILFVSNANAGIFLEPYLGYYKGETDSQLTLGGESSTDEKGFGYGGRLGFTIMSTFFVAGDVTLIKGDSKATSGVENDLEVLDYGAVAGFRLGNFRIWGGKIFKAETEVQSSGTVTKYKGDGLKAGVGIMLYNKISLNIEYSKREFESVNDVDFPTAGTDSMESSGYFASISFPIGF